ncbi:phage tail protein [Vibrio parahaemolyticus]|uniref:phage tail protein n=1 Tax=Vibrio parahaemolyticus TaxID=670 RepID=UPI002153664F|nr:phage tail protein [Vibrio parahaemolyticus]
MANTTDNSILTAAGKALLAQLNAEEKPLIIDKMIFANVPNRPEFPQPDDMVPTDHVVHQEGVEQRGRLSADSVIYSTTLTSDVGPFEFNWTGAYCSEYGVLVTIDHHALTPKSADEPGVAGNTLVRSVVLEYKDIAEITNITVDASSWQYNATPRMKKMDDDVAQAIIDQNGKDWFIEDGFLVTPQASAFNIKAGAGYVSGNRVILEFDRNVQVPNKPSFIYVDAHREGTPTGEQVTLFDFVVTAEEKDDYTDANGVKHFICKIGQVLADGSVSDLRKKNLISTYAESTYDLHTRTSDLHWTPNTKVDLEKSIQIYSHKGIDGVTRSYLPNVKLLPFVTGESFEDDIAANKWIEDKLLTKEKQWRLEGDVRGWGVLCDGETDETERIRHVLLNSGAMVVKLPPMPLKFSSVYVPAHVHLMGSGDNSVIKPINESGQYAISFSAMSSGSNFSMDGTNSKGFGIQVSNRCTLTRVSSYNFKNDENYLDGRSFILEGAYSSFFDGLISKQCRSSVMIGKPGTNLENNANKFNNCGFEYTLEPALIVNKANILSLTNCYYGRHGGNYGQDADGTAVLINDPDAGVIIDGFYTEWCLVGIESHAKYLEVKNSRLSSKIKLHAGSATVHHNEFYGYGGYIEVLEGSTATCVEFCNSSNGYAPIVKDEANFESRITRLAYTNGRVNYKNSLRAHGVGSDIESQLGNITAEKGSLLAGSGDGTVAVAASGGGDIRIWGGSGQGRFENVNAGQGMVLKDSDAKRWHIYIGTDGQLKISAL